MITVYAAEANVVLTRHLWPRPIRRIRRGDAPDQPEQPEPAVVPVPDPRPVDRTG
jgi:hypothetical protein